MTENSRVRVSIVGVVIVALFSALLGRLWFLQMGPDAGVEVQGIARVTRVVQTETPRGRILDRNGVVLVDNRVAWAITVERTIDAETRTRVLGQLAELLGPPFTSEQLAANYDDVRQSPLKPAIVAFDVPEPVRVAVMERIEDYPGVRVQKMTVRHYPQGRLAAHLLGYVGEISEEQLERRRDDGYVEGDTIGRAGVERAYESVLRGEPRRERLEVDPTGRPVGPPLDVEPGRVGDDLHLTIDATWQRAAEESLWQGIDAARRVQNEDRRDRYETLRAPAGAVVVLDVRDGSVAAMASYPDYDPAQFVDGISQVEWADLNDNPDRHKPLLNRATQGQYAPGSTFKLVTSLAMVRHGIRGPGEWYEDRGFVEIRGTDYQNAGRVRLGSVNLQRALTVSSDTYYYTGGFEFWKLWDAGDSERGLGLQATARELGFGAMTGFELDEAAGTVPDPDWKRDLSYRINDTDEAKRENAIWYPADDILMAIGQGGLSVTPLQLANAYAAFANGSTLWKPRLALEARDASGTVTQQMTPEALRQIAFDPGTRSVMMAGFEGVVDDDDGTAYGAFRGFPLDAVPVAGKTGTAQVQDKADTSWFVGYLPAHAPEYVVAAVVEEGGRGSQVAAPIVRRVIEAMTGGDAAPVEVLDRGRD
jgi:penicillin-binding protein 2